MKTSHRILLILLLPVLNLFAQDVASSGLKASDLIGADVKNREGQDVGDVKDVVVDLKSGKVVAVVVSTGGFLGMGDTLSSIPPTALEYDRNTKALRLGMTKEELGKVPQSKPGITPNPNDVKAPDNTGRNERDRSDQAVTPMDQGNGDSDLKTTQAIRSAVMQQNLSFDAKNVKIITKDGKVLLRGVVNSQEEHDQILKLAQSHADSSKITDNLEVKNH